MSSPGERVLEAIRPAVQEALADEDQLGVVIVVYDARSDVVDAVGLGIDHARAMTLLAQYARIATERRMEGNGSEG